MWLKFFCMNVRQSYPHPTSGALSRVNFQRGNKAGSAAAVALQMTVYSDWNGFVCSSVCSVKTLVELLLGIDYQILKKTFLVTKDFPHRLHSSNLSQKVVNRG